MQPRQQSWPRMWLMTDERMGERLWEALGQLPKGAGIVFRHYSLAPEAREKLAAELAAMANERRLMLAIATDPQLAQRSGARLVHNPNRPTQGQPFSTSVHSLEEAQAARWAGAALVFVSPVYPTRSHPGKQCLGPDLAGEIARAAGVPAIALGGMDERRFALLERKGFYGWAGIDAWLRT